MTVFAGVIHLLPLHHHAHSWPLGMISSQPPPRSHFEQKRVSTLKNKHFGHCYLSEKEEEKFSNHFGIFSTCSPRACAVVAVAAVVVVVVVVDCQSLKANRHCCMRGVRGGEGGLQQIIKLGKRRNMRSLFMSSSSLFFCLAVRVWLPAIFDT